jgi:hypothetical protein
LSANKYNTISKNCQEFRKIDFYQIDTPSVYHRQLFKKNDLRKRPIDCLLMIFTLQKVKHRPGFALPAPVRLKNLPQYGLKDVKNLAWMTMRFRSTVTSWKKFFVAGLPRRKNICCLVVHNFMAHNILWIFANFPFSINLYQMRIKKKLDFIALTNIFY